MKDYFKVHLGKVILFLSIVFILIGIVICHDDLCLWEKYGNVVAGFATLASVYFLYTSNPQPIGFRGNLLVKRQKFFYCTYSLGITETS